MKVTIELPINEFDSMREKMENGERYTRLIGELNQFKKYREVNPHTPIGMVGKTGPYLQMDAHQLFEIIERHLK